MRELLSPSSQRMIDILEALSAHPGWTTFADLSAAVQASERTVAEDIAYLKKHWGQILNLELSKKNGIKLQNQNTASLGLVFNDLFNESVALRWLKELLFHPQQTAGFYENKLFVSRSTLSRLLPRINRYLAGRGMSIDCRNNRYQLLGKDEHYLRDFSASFLLELYGLDLNKYDLTLDLTLIKDLILSVLTNHLQPRELDWVLDDDISLVYQIMLYLVSLVRENQGYRIISSYPVEEDICTLNWHALQQQFPHLTIDSLRPIHHCIYIQYRGWNSPEEEALVTQETAAFLERVFSAISVSLDEGKRYLLTFIAKSLYLSAKFRPFKTSALFDRVYYFSLSLKRTSPLLYQVLTESLIPFSRRLNLDMSAKTGDFLFWMCLICPELYQVAQAKTALLISDFGKPHARFLAQALTDFFTKRHSPLLRIEIAPYPDILLAPVPGFDIQGYDLLLTTIPNLPLSHRQIFLLNDYPSYNELHKIYETFSLTSPASSQPAFPRS